MSDDIRIRRSLVTHRKINKLMRKLGKGSFYNLICLWIDVSENRPKGVLTNYDKEDIAIAAKWAGDAETFVESLIALSLLDVENGVYFIHDWAEYNPLPKFSNQGERPSGSAWNKIKRIVFNRDKYICSYCGTTQENMHCDHIVPIARGGSNDLENLTTACPKCNLSKGSKTLEVWLNEY